MRRWPYLALGSLALAADRFTKWWVLRSLAPGESIPLVDGFLRLTRVHNPGGAFGFLPQGRVAFLLLSGGVAVAATWALLLGLPGTRWPRLGLALLWAGAWGNFIDRLLYGHVLDFIEVPHFPVFNLADSAVVAGAALLALGLLWRRP
jgi:signal peptidase II